MVKHSKRKMANRRSKKFGGKKQNKSHRKASKHTLRNKLGQYISGGEGEQENTQPIVNNNLMNKRLAAPALKKKSIMEKLANIGTNTRKYFKDVGENIGTRVQNYRDTRKNRSNEKRIRNIGYSGIVDEIIRELNK